MLRSNRTLAATIPLHCCDIAFHASSDVLQLLSASRCWPAGTTSYAEQASELLSFHSFCLIATFHCWLESTFGVHREDLHHISCSICPPGWVGGAHKDFGESLGEGLKPKRLCRELQLMKHCISRLCRLQHAAIQSNACSNNTPSLL